MTKIDLDQLSNVVGGAGFQCKQGETPLSCLGRYFGLSGGSDRKQDASALPKK
jgi:hypothetical protein